MAILHGTAELAAYPAMNPHEISGRETFPFDYLSQWPSEHVEITDVTTPTDYKTLQLTKSPAAETREARGYVSNPEPSPPSVRCLSERGGSTTTLQTESTTTR